MRFLYHLNLADMSPVIFSFSLFLGVYIVVSVAQSEVGV